MSCKNPKYWDRQAWANSADQDHMLQNATEPGVWSGSIPFASHPVVFRHIKG